ncbi:hypothetical protein ACFW9D_15410 [Streptomyces sp. NPDC059524]|uniref:hypothetical protein n=1 Tax=Streptomyces sp. NPDC059524 TaxID=3346856 RepID=UPI00367A8E4D
MAAAGAEAPYVYAQGARKIGAAANSADAQRLTAGETYRSTLGTGASGVSYYRVELDGAADAYASVVAVPPLGSSVKVAYADGITVSLQDSKGNRCDSARAGFRSGAYPRPIAAAAGRLVRPGGLRCQSAGTYYVVVERASAAASTREKWGLELRVATEPGLVTPGPSTGPTAWPSGTSSAGAGSGPGRRRVGGTGFNDAKALDDGVWTDRIGPGQSHFYRVPVDWGQQLSVDAELGSSAGDAGRRGTVTGALEVELFNPARAQVAAEQAVYAGDPTSAGFDPLPPVAYENRRLVPDDQAAMRLAGWYYVEVTLNPAMARKFGDKASDVTLKVGVEGEPGRAPDYVRDPGEFQVTAEDRAAAQRGDGGAEWADVGVDGGGADAGADTGGERSGGGSAVPTAAAGSGRGDGAGKAGAGAAAASAEERPMMRVLGFAGVGTGAALVLWLGIWRVVAVRSVRARG